MDRRLKSYCILFVLILFTAVILSGCLSGRTSLEVPDANETQVEETNVQLRMLTTMDGSFASAESAMRMDTTAYNSMTTVLRIFYTRIVLHGKRCICLTKYLLLMIMLQIQAGLRMVRPI